MWRIFRKYLASEIQTIKFSSITNCQGILLCSTMIYVRPQLSRKKKPVHLKQTILLEFFSFLLTISKEVSKLAWMNMFMDLKEKRFIEFKGLWKLFGQMPHTFQELSKHRWDFLWVTIQMATPNPPESTSFWKCLWEKTSVQVLLNLNTHTNTRTKNFVILALEKYIFFLLKQFKPEFFNHNFKGYVIF